MTKPLSDVKTIVLNFRPQFSEIVKNGTKTQTIRKSIPDWAFQAFCRGKLRTHLYRGLRTKGCEKIGVGSVFDFSTVCLFDRCVEIWGGAKFICDDEALNKFALDDGFNDYGEMLDFFIKTHGASEDSNGPVFRGVLVKWILQSEATP